MALVTGTDRVLGHTSDTIPAAQRINDNDFEEFLGNHFSRSTALKDGLTTVFQSPLLIIVVCLVVLLLYAVRKAFKQPEVVPDCVPADPRMDLSLKTRSTTSRSMSRQYKPIPKRIRPVCRLARQPAPTIVSAVNVV